MTRHAPYGASPVKTARNSEAKFQAIVETTSDGILIADDKGCYLDANAVACRLFGMPRKSILGRHVEDFADPKRKHEVQANWRRFLKQGYQRGFFRIYRPDGTSRYVDYIARAHILPNHIFGLLGVAQDSSRHVIEGILILSNQETIRFSLTRERLP